MKGWLYYGNSQQSIQAPYNNGWSSRIYMMNGGNFNIDITFVNVGQFTADYRKSTGT